jgi:hypothetical protein
MTRGMSFNAETGEKESAQELWESSSWVKMGRSRGMTMDRSNTFVGAASIPEEAPLVDEIIVVVDPFSTGAHLAAEVCKNGFKCARVFSVWDSPVAALVQKGLRIDFCATVQFNDRIEHELALMEVRIVYFMLLIIIILFFFWSCIVVVCACVRASVRCLHFSYTP